MVKIEIKASSRYPIRRKRIKKKIEEVLGSFEIEGNIEVEIGIVGDRKMQSLKKEYLGIDETTDVLSFPLQENILKTNDMDSRSLLLAKSRMTQNKLKNISEFVEFPDGIMRLGSIFVSYPQAQRQANLHKLMIDEEIEQLVEHGMMHLLGIHHE